jgi:hypothetical protein
VTIRGWIISSVRWRSIPDSNVASVNVAVPIVLSSLRIVLRRAQDQDNCFAQASISFAFSRQENAATRRARVAVLAVKGLKAKRT